MHPLLGFFAFVMIIGSIRVTIDMIYCYAKKRAQEKEALERRREAMRHPWIVAPPPQAQPVQSPRSFVEQAVAQMNPQSIKVHRIETVDRFPDGRVIARKEETIIVEGQQQQAAEDLSWMLQRRQSHD